MAYTRWSDIREEHIERIGRAEFEAGKEQMLAEARGWRLAEIRRRRGFTQAQVAERMGVGKSRVSQIETGKVATRDVLDRYVEALGGRLSLMADFGDELLRVGWATACRLNRGSADAIAGTSAQVVASASRPVVLIIRRSWVRSPPAQPRLISPP